jgi:uncharacterized membrane protein HdeD (DUF308 family)
MFGAAFILAGVAVPLLAVAIRSGEGLVFPLVFGGLSLWCGYLMLHGPRGGGR